MEGIGDTEKRQTALLLNLLFSLWIADRNDMKPIIGKKSVVALLIPVRISGRQRSLTAVKMLLSSAKKSIDSEQPKQPDRLSARVDRLALMMAGRKGEVV